MTIKIPYDDSKAAEDGERSKTSQLQLRKQTCNNLQLKKCFSNQIFGSQTYSNESMTFLNHNATKFREKVTKIVKSLTVQQTSGRTIFFSKFQLVYIFTKS